MMKRYIMTALLPIFLTGCSNSSTGGGSTSDITNYNIEDGTYPLVYVTDIDDEQEDMMEVGLKTDEVRAIKVHKEDLVTETIKSGDNEVIIEGEEVTVRRHDPSDVKDESFDAVVKSKEKVEKR